MLDVYIKGLIIHQFSPNSTDLLLSQDLVQLTPRLDAYFRKKLSRVFSDEAKRGRFEEHHPFLEYLNDDLKASSLAVSQVWQSQFVLSDDQKTSDLVFLEFTKADQLYWGFLRLALKDQLVHQGSGKDPISLSQNNLPSASQRPDDALIINRTTKDYYLLEKRVKHDGQLLSYFSKDFLAVEPQESLTKSVKTLEKTAQKVAETFHQDDFSFAAKVKTAITNHLEESDVLSPELLAEQLFDQQVSAKLTFLEEMKDNFPEPVKTTGIDYSKQVKRLSKQKLSLSNGIELVVPNQLYQDAEAVEFIENEDGTYAILIKNIEAIRNH